MLCLCRRRQEWRRFRLPFMAEQRAALVNAKLKWVKDRPLDSVVSRERHLRPALHLVHLISSHPGGRAVPSDLAACRRKFGIPTADIAAFMRRFPTLFRESPDSIPWFFLTADALRIRRQELEVLAGAEEDLVGRLRRLLMLSAGRSLPLDTVDQLRWDMGLPSDYHLDLVHRHPEAFDVVRPPDDERLWLKLVSWDPRLAISELQKKGASTVVEESESNCLAFPVKFTRGFGLKKKSMAWLREWQTLPYTSPYADGSELDPRTDVSEKRIVGVFHELLHLTIAKKTERRNVSNLRKPLGLPQKFTKVFERHPGIFYLSEKLATQTIVLREAYDGRELQVKHPLQEIREKYMALLRTARPNRTRGSLEKETDDDSDAYAGEFSDERCGFSGIVSDDDGGDAVDAS